MSRRMLEVQIRQVNAQTFVHNYPWHGLLTNTSFKKVGVKILFNNDAVTKIKVKHVFIQPPSYNLCNH